MNIDCNNIYEYLIKENKEIIDFLENEFDTLKLYSSNEDKINKIKKLKEINKDIVFYEPWDIECTDTFKYTFQPINKKINGNIFALNAKKFEFMFGIKIKDFHININILKDINKKDVIDKTFSFKNIGVDKNYLYYNVNVNKFKDDTKMIEIVIGHNSGIVSLAGEKYKIVNIIAAIMPEKEKGFNFYEIEKKINEEKIDLFKILLGNLDYKKKLEDIFEYEGLINDERELKSFIEHENIFGVLNLSNFKLTKN